MSEKVTDSIDTPALLLNKETMEQNLNDIVQFARKHHVAYRPHIKTHKSVEIAKKQLDAGAVGVTVATVGEAEVMAKNGIDDILLAFPIFNEEKLERIYRLLNFSKITLAVDSVEQTKVIDQFFKEKNLSIDVWLKVNSGLDRCGIEVLEVESFITATKELENINITGIFTHAGHSYGAQSEEELKEIAEQEADVVLKSAAIFDKVGVPVKHKSIGSTPTFKLAGKVNGITEIRPGNAIFYDMVQVSLGVSQIENCALTVKSTVSSIKKDRIVIDAGSKTLNLDKGAHGNESIKGHGYIKEYPELIITRLSEEHGVIDVDTSEYPHISLGETVTIIPNHACTVVNLFDKYTVIDDSDRLDLIPVDARGCNR